MNQQKPTILYYKKRDLLLKNSFNQSAINLNKKAVCHLNANLNRGINSKRDLLLAGFFIAMIASQSPTRIRAKKSSALYKNRKSELMGWKVTLRKHNFHTFIIKYNTFVQAQEQTTVKISNVSSTIEFNNSIMPAVLNIHIRK
jgi:ribosomal protein L5